MPLTKNLATAMFTVTADINTKNRLFFKYLALASYLEADARFHCPCSPNVFPYSKKITGRL